MPDIPDEFVTDAMMGQFPAIEFESWLDSDADEETRDFIEEATDAGLSLEWAVIAADRDMDADPSEWDHASIIRDQDGDWAVAIIDSDGETHVIEFDDETVAQDLIWADLYFHLVDYGIEFDKDIDSGEAA